MKLLSEKPLKAMCATVCIVSLLSALFGAILLPYGIIFIISGLLATAFAIYITNNALKIIKENQDLNTKFVDLVNNQSEGEKEKQKYSDLKEKMNAEYEEHQKRLQQEYDEYEKQKKADYEKFIKTRDEKIKELENATSLEIENNKKRLLVIKEEIEEATRRKSDIESEVKDAETEHERIKEKINQELSEQNKTLADIKSEILEGFSKMVISQYNYSDYDGVTSEECKDKLAVIKVKERELLSEKIKGILDNQHIITSENRKRANIFRETIRCYDAECNNAIINLTSQNINAQREKISRSYKSLNKLNDINGIELPVELLELKLEELNLCYTHELKKQQEAEEQKEIRQQMLEEEKVRQEIEREKIRIQREENQFKNEVNKLMLYLNRTSNDAEKELYIAKINELEEKLKELSKDKENVFKREQNTRAGFVYVISNIGSFGDGIYKIGMTRRLVPMDRIKELSSASVPFPFDVHAIIFSDDAPALEAKLHNKFKDNRVNMVNDKKEFFKVNLEEIKDAVLSDYNNTVKFTMIAEAEEYRRTLEMQKARA